MEYKILEANGVDNENVDGSALNNFIASGENGIIKGVLNECIVYLVNRNTVAMDTGEILIQGFRIKILSAYTVSRSDSGTSTDYQVIARLTLSTDRSVNFDIVCRTPSSLRTDSLYRTESGVYEIELIRFTTNLNGVQNLKRIIYPIDMQSVALESANIAKNMASQALQQTETNSDKISRNTKAIENLESQLSSDLIIESRQFAYTVPVPARSAPYAKITMFGGMSYKPEKIITFERYSGFIGGSAWLTVLPDGSISVDLAAESTEEKVISTFSLGVGTYYLSTIQTHPYTRVYLRKNGTLLISLDGDDETYILSVDNATDEYSISIVVLAGGGFTMDRVKIMFHDFQGLRHAKPTAFKSVGANLWSVGDIVSSGYTYDITNVFEHLTPNKQYALSWTYSSNGTSGAQNLIIIYTEAGGFNIANGASFTITEEQINTFTSAYAYFGSDATNGSMTNIMLNQGETALPYKPYREPITLPIPTEVQGIDGYGLGINENAYNYVDWIAKKYHKVVGMVDLGMLDWQWNAPYWVSPDIASIALINWRAPDFLAENYNTSGWDDKTQGDIAQNGEGYIVIVGEETSQPTGKLLFALKTPEIIDISDILPDDNLIAVEGGGTIIAENEYGYAVPSEIVYQLMSAGGTGGGSSLPQYLGEYEVIE